MSGPRNPKAFRAAKRVRAAVRLILSQRSQLEPLITGEDLRRMLPSELRRGLRTINAHMAAARLEHEIEVLAAEQARREEQALHAAAPREAQ